MRSIISVITLSDFIRLYTAIAGDMLSVRAGQRPGR
jgi:hypothetical protein